MFKNAVITLLAIALLACDAAYLELALREGLPLATLDNELKKAARAEGGRLFVPA